MEDKRQEKRILLAVTGLSPQVVTETLYALAVKRDPAWVPHEVHIVTTASGAERARLSLLGKGWFQRLLEDYQLPEVTFSEAHITVLKDAQGQPLEDIRSPEDNERAADTLTDLVRRFTQDPSTALHVSIAGGRKTMGYYLGYALSLFGRPQDRLSHVLVSEPFESCWDFFYPTPYEHIIQTRDNDLADARNAQVTLAEIPFVSLRHGLDRRLLEGDASFSEVVAAARASLEPPALEINLPGQYVVAGGTRVDLPPAQLAFYALFARRAKAGQPPIQAPVKGVPDPQWAADYLREYRAIRSGALEDLERTEKALGKGMDGDYFSARKSALHRALKRALGIAAKPYLIDDGGCRPRAYALKLPPETITIVEDAP